MVYKIRKENPIVNTAQGLQVRSTKMHEHFLFNFLNFLYFRKNDCNNCFLIENHPLGVFIIVPYIIFSEAYFFRQRRYFLIQKQQIVGLLTLQEKANALYIVNLAVSPSYRKLGVATQALNYSAKTAQRLHKYALELSVFKANSPALRLYWKYGFRKKKEKRLSIVLSKTLKIR
jgi:ribosomal protein S18 acetylase RimI-like enzyme